MPQSLQCPRCNGAVSVADHAAGQRVKCPHCEQTFLAPGIAAATNDDDDWLQLEETPHSAPNAGAVAPAETSLPASPASVSRGDAPPTPKPVSGKRTTPSLSADDEALLAEFNSDLDEFTAEIEAPPPPHPSSPASKTPSPRPPASPGSKAAAGVPNVSGAPNVSGVPNVSGAPKAKPKPVPVPAAADVVEYASEYKVNCSICGTFVYAKAEQAGRTVKCGDCHSPITIPPPPRVRKKTVHVDMEEAQTFEFEQSKAVERGSDPYQKSAEQLLEDASREEEADPKPKFDDTPSVKEWAMNVFGVFLDLGVLVHWIALSAIASVPAAIALGSEMRWLVLGLFPGGLFLGVLTVSCGFAIMHAVANKETRVSGWPTLDPFAWLGQMFVVVAAASVASIPILLACMIVGVPSLLTAALTMFSIYIVFPFVLLSMLDMNSAFVPFSPEVARSVTKCEEAWGGFYFSAGLLFVGLFLIYATVSWMEPTPGVALAIFATIGIAFAYFSLIGRLAYAIGQAVNAPPRPEE